MTFTLVPAPPFRLDLTVWTLRRRPNNAIDRWDGGVYRRVLVARDVRLEIAVAQAGSRIEIDVSADGRLPRDARRRVTAALERTLGLRVDLAPFYRFARDDPRLGALAERFRGFKPPCFPTVFEALLNAFACQQLSISVGLTLLNRLADRYGGASSDGAAHAFPEPAALAGARVDAVKRLGFNRAKSRGIIELSRAIAGRRLDLETLRDLDDAAATSALLGLRSVGRWSAEYVLLRGLGRVHVFPGDDVGARKALGQWLGGRTVSDYDAVKRALSRWRPWAGLVYFHLLLRGLDDRGQLGDGRRPVTRRAGRESSASRDARSRP